MSDACCGVDDTAPVPEQTRPWWRDPAIGIPAASGLAFAAGLAADYSGVRFFGTDLGGQLLLWIGLLLGGSTFVPGALRSLFTRGRLGIGLLMTISAVGAVILGHVEEAAALAFL